MFLKSGAMPQCGCADWAGKKKQASSITDVAVFILEDLNCYAAAISTSIAFWISEHHSR